MTDTSIFLSRAAQNALKKADEGFNVFSNRAGTELELTGLAFPRLTSINPKTGKPSPFWILTYQGLDKQKELEISHGKRKKYARTGPKPAISQK